MTLPTTCGYVMLDQFTPADIDLFWANWKLGPRAKGKRLTTLRAFFRFSVNRKWIPSRRSAPTSRQRSANRAANKAPFTDDEIDRIIDACDQVKVEWENETGLVWTGEDLKDLIWLMLYTGLRISDATLFSTERCMATRSSSVRRRTAAMSSRMCPIGCGTPGGTRQAIRPAAIHRGGSDRLETIRHLAPAASQGVHRGGPFEEPPTPHRFVTRSPASCCRKAFQSPMSPTFWATTKRRCGNTMPAGCPSGRSG